jgi:uncharacterized glyoxalase superfamily protein PhnB
MISNRSIPRCTVIPQLAYPDVAAAVAWLCAAFGFTVRITIGNHRVQLNIGDGALVIMESHLPPDSGPQPRNPSEFGHVMIRVEEIDRHCARAKEGGAKMVRPLADYPYGERQYTAADFAGRLWTFTQSVADVAPESWGGTSVQL